MWWISGLFGFLRHYSFKQLCNGTCCWEMKGYCRDLSGRLEQGVTWHPHCQRHEEWKNSRRDRWNIQGRSWCFRKSLSKWYQTVDRVSNVRMSKWRIEEGGEAGSLHQQQGHRQLLFPPAPCSRAKWGRNFYFCFILKWSHYLAQAGLECIILLPQLHECGDYPHHHCHMTLYFSETVTYFPQADLLSTIVVSHQNI